MYRKDMEEYKRKLRNAIDEDITDMRGLETLKEKYESELEKIIQEIYEHGYEDGINEKEHEQEKEPVPWEDLDWYKWQNLKLAIW